VIYYHFSPEVKPPDIQMSNFALRISAFVQHASAYVPHRMAFTNFPPLILLDWGDLSRQATRECHEIIPNNWETPNAPTSAASKQLSHQNKAEVMPEMASQLAAGTS